MIFLMLLVSIPVAHLHFSFSLNSLTEKPIITSDNFVFLLQQMLSATIGDRFSLALFSLSLRATLKVAGKKILLARAHTVLLVATALANAGPADSSKSLSSSWSQTLWRL